MTPLAAEIDTFLRSRYTWVKADEICERFGVDERQLRTVGDTPGLCSEFAISSNAGYKHVRNATTDEFDDFIARLRSHGVSELRRVKTLRLARHNQLTGKPTYEVATGQGMLL